MTRITEADIETMVEVEQMEIREAIAEYHKWKGIVDEMERNMETPEMELLKDMMFPADEVYANALDKLESAIDKLDCMGVVEYE
jgi:hypothetical protein